MGQAQEEGVADVPQELVVEPDQKGVKIDKGEDQPQKDQPQQEQIQAKYQAVLSIRLLDFYRNVPIEL